jgi:hypothetical protein
VGSFSDLDTLMGLKVFLNSMGTSNYNIEMNECYFSDFRFSYLLNSSIISLEEVFLSLLVQLDMRQESPLLFTRIRKSFINNFDSFTIFSLGVFCDYSTFPIFHIGSRSIDFLNLFTGKFYSFAKFFHKDFLSFKFLNINLGFYCKFNIFTGCSLLYRRDSFSYQEQIYFFRSFLTKKFGGNLVCTHNIVSNYLGKLSCFENNLLPGINYFKFHSNKKNELFYCIGTNIFSYYVKKSTLIFYQGFFNVPDINVFLYFPSSIFTERFSSFINLEGRLRRSVKSVVSNTFVFDDTDIAKCLYFFKKNFLMSNFSKICNFFKVVILFKNLVDYSCTFYVYKFIIFDDYLSFNKS